MTKKEKSFYFFSVILILGISYLAYKYGDLVKNAYIYKNVPDVQKNDLARHIQFFLFSYALIMIVLVASYLQLITLRKQSIFMFEVCILASIVLAFLGIEKGNDFAIVAWGKSNELETSKILTTYIFIGMGGIAIVVSSILRYMQKEKYLKILSIVSATLLLAIIIINISQTKFVADLHPSLAIFQNIKYF